MATNDANERIYLHEDVFIHAHQADKYMANQGSWWSFSPEFRYEVVGMFKHLRPSGRWPRGVNLWETNWTNLEGALTEQFGATPDPSSAGPPADDSAHNEWFAESATQRSGGWDRVMRPGPGSPSVAELQHGPKRPCIVEQTVRLRLGTKADYLNFVSDEVVPAVAETDGWQVQMWLGAMHGSTAKVLIAAPDWTTVGQLAQTMPIPDSRWEAVIETSFLHAWEGSALLKRAE